MRHLKRNILIAGAAALLATPAITFALLPPTPPQVVEEEEVPEAALPLPDFREKSYLSAKPNVKKDAEVHEARPSGVVAEETPETSTEDEWKFAVPEPITEAEPSGAEDPGVSMAAPISANVFWIGDSVSYLAKSQILAQFPDAEVNAVSGRTLAEGVSALQERAASGFSPASVVVELGSNTVAEKEEFRREYEELLSLIPDDTPVFAVTIKTKGKYHNMHNDCIKELAEAHPNVHVVDWYEVACANEEWLSDGCHPTYPAGAEHFVSFVQEAMSSVL